MVKDKDGNETLFAAIGRSPEFARVASDAITREVFRDAASAAAILGSDVDEVTRPARPRLRESVVVDPGRVGAPTSPLPHGSASMLGGEMPLTFDALMGILHAQRTWGPNNVPMMLWALATFVSDLRIAVGALAERDFREEPTAIGDARLEVGPGSVISIPLERWRAAWAGMFVEPNVPVDLEDCLVLIRRRMTESRTLSAEIIERAHCADELLAKVRDLEHQIRVSSSRMSGLEQRLAAQKLLDPTIHDAIKLAHEERDAMRAQIEETKHILGAGFSGETLKGAAERVESALAERVRERDAWRNAMAWIADQIGIGRDSSGHDGGTGNRTPTQARDAISNRLLDLQNRANEKPLAKLTSVEEIDWSDALSAAERLVAACTTTPRLDGQLSKHEEHRAMVRGLLDEVATALRLVDAPRVGDGEGRTVVGRTDHIAAALGTRRLESGLRPLTLIGKHTMPTGGGGGSGTGVLLAGWTEAQRVCYQVIEAILTSPEACAAGGGFEVRTVPQRDGRPSRTELLVRAPGAEAMSPGHLLAFVELGVLRVRGSGQFAPPFEMSRFVTIYSDFPWRWADRIAAALSDEAAP